MASFTLHALSAIKLPSTLKAHLQHKMLQFTRTKLNRFSTKLDRFSTKHKDTFGMAFGTAAVIPAYTGLSNQSSGDRHNSKLDDMRKYIDEQLGDINERFNSTEVRLKNIDTKLKTIQDDIKTGNDNTSAIQTDVETLKKRPCFKF